MDVQHRAEFETTRRLLPHLLNEGITKYHVMLDETDCSGWLKLSEKAPPSARHQRHALVLLTSAKVFALAQNTAKSIAWTCDDFEPCIVLVEKFPQAIKSSTSLHPRQLFEFLCGRYAVAGFAKQNICNELQNSAENQERWLLERAGILPQIESSLIEWESCMFTGHPSHPMHRCLLPQWPLPDFKVDQLTSILNPEIILITLNEGDVRTVGSFQRDIQPLYEKAHAAPCPAGKVILPARLLQLPAIQHFYPHVERHPSDSLFGKSQSSTRTISMDSSLNFDFHVKLPISCNISSSSRVFTPNKVAMGPEISRVMQKLLPKDLWVFEETSCVVGDSTNPGSGQIGCVLRRDIEGFARKQGQSLIVAGALAERPSNGMSNAERVFNLQTHADKTAFLRNYVMLLLETALRPLIDAGVSMFAHAQNMLVRVDIASSKIIGFAARDMANIRVHLPTLQANTGMTLDLESAHQNTIATPLDVIWSNFQNVVFQNHLTPIITALGLAHSGGWKVVREELDRILPAHADGMAGDLRRFLLAETMPTKCFMRMKMEQRKTGDFIFTDIPNILLS